MTEQTPDFIGAGVLFMNPFHKKVLAGFHPKLGLWSGFGGKRQGQETIAETAFREVIEEMFGINLEKKDTIDLTASVRARFPIPADGYYIYCLPISAIFMLVSILERKSYTSPYYETLPHSISELLECRSPTLTAEITKIQVFDLDRLDYIKHYVTSEFYKDLQRCS
jgi:8-oxo-dGTP pyrophosphatase MutT (NUDIX family)